MRSGGHGRMLIVDASCLFELVVGTQKSDRIANRIATEDQAAPHVIDVEVAGVIRRQHLLGHLDITAASLAVEKLRAWPVERFGHQLLLDRAWALRGDVRTWDAMYVALAEALDATLLTMDGRLANSSGPQCPIEILGAAES